MQYVDYNIASSNKEITESNGIIALYKQLNQNITHYRTYIDNTAIRFDSGHILVKLCNSISDYFTGTPTESYDAISERLEYFARLFNFGHVGAKVVPCNVVMGDDLLVCIDTPSWKLYTNGVLNTPNKPFMIYSHDSVSLDFADYIDNTSGNGYSLIGINIPLLGQLLHQYINDQLKSGVTWNINTFLTKWAVSECITDNINIALMNRFSLDATNSELGKVMYSSVERALPYASVDVNGQYLRVRDEFVSTFKKIGTGNIADLNDNIPLLNDITPMQYLANFEDYYVDNLMWINAYAEVVQYKRLTNIASNSNLRLNLASTDRRLQALLRPSRFDVCLKGLDGITAKYVADSVEYTPK